MNDKYDMIKCLPENLQKTVDFVLDDLQGEIINILSQNEAPLSGHITSYKVNYKVKQ